MTRMAAGTARSTILVLAACAVVGLAAVPQGKSYSRSFDGGTMRVDFLHTGGPGGEQLPRDQGGRDGPGPGSPPPLLDDTNLGESFFEVSDPADGGTLYSRGFGSIYGEWITTPEFQTTR